MKLPIQKIPISEFCINVDTREHAPYQFFSSIKGKIDVGDYALAGSAFNNVIVERKSIQDFGGTMSVGYDRFERELQRVRASGRYLIILIEYPVSDIYGYRFYGKCQAGYLCHNLRELFRSYIDCCQFVFGGYRWQCQKMVPMLLLCGEATREIDLQLWTRYNGIEQNDSVFSQKDLQHIYDYSS